MSVFNDLLALDDYETNWGQLLNINTLATLFFPLSSTAAEQGASAASEIGQVFDPASFDLNGLLGGFDASGFDLSACSAASIPLNSTSARCSVDLTQPQYRLSSPTFWKT